MTKGRRRTATTTATATTATSSMIQRFDFPSAAVSGDGPSPGGTASPWPSAPSIALSSITRPAADRRPAGGRFIGRSEQECHANEPQLARARGGDLRFLRDPGPLGGHRSQLRHGLLLLRLRAGTLRLRRLFLALRRRRPR